MVKFIRVYKREPFHSVVRRFVRSAWRWMFNRWPGANHYCPGDSGSGHWSCRSIVPSVCGYCGEANDALRAQRATRESSDG